MKILIIGFAKIKFMPYVNFYLEQLTGTNNEVHLLYWNRDAKEDITLNFNVVFHEFKLLQKDQVPRYKKIRSFFLFRRYSKNIIKQENYDFIILLQSNPGILLFDILQRKYKKNYLLDFRDLIITNNKIVKRLINLLVSNSKATFISSDDYRKYLPLNSRLYTTHNLLVESLNYRNVRNKSARNVLPIRISFWGLIRDESINKSIIGDIANDDRFELHYYGREQEVALCLKDYCSLNHIKNVYFHGEYIPEDRYKFAENTDILHNCYENISGTNPSMGNKFYDGIIFYLPQICTPGSFMGEQVEKAGVGITCDPYRKSYSDAIFSYYQSIVWDEFEKNCDIELNRVSEQYYESREILNNFIK